MRDPQPIEPDEESSEELHEEEAIGKAYDSRLLGRLWPYMRPHLGLVSLTLALVFPLFLLELAPAWIIKTGLDRVIAPAAAVPAAADPSLLGRLLDGPEGVPELLWLAGLYLSVMVMLSALEFLRSVVMTQTGHAAMLSLRKEVFAHIQRLHLGFFDRYPVGRLVTRATNDVENVAEMFSAGIVAFVTDLLKMIGFATALFLVNAKLAMVTFSVVPLLAVAAVVFRLRVREAFRKIRVRIARINTYLQETISGMKVVQLFTRESRNLREFERLNAAHRDAWFQSIRYDSALFSVVELAQYLTVALVVWRATSIAEIGVIYVFIDWMRRFFLPLRDLSAKYSVMQSSMAGCERIFQLLDTPPAIQDAAPSLPRLSRSAAPRQGAVEFQDVWFSYSGSAASGGPASAQRDEGAREDERAAPQARSASPAASSGPASAQRDEGAREDERAAPQARSASPALPSGTASLQAPERRAQRSGAADGRPAERSPEDWVLRGVSFRVEPGEKVAFVGATGAGKTTIINLLTRLYEVSRGRILLDGVDLREIPQAQLRSRVAMVLQDVFLFSGSVADNIALGRDDIDAERIERACRAVDAHRFIERLPRSYATELRERGGDLSAGQRQLLSFARALAHGADVLVLDEATSSIDTETETLVQHGVHVLMEGKTSLVIAHRLSTIEDVDRIYVLHHGRIVEAGSHAELLARGGIYHRLYRLQYARQSAGPAAAAS
jgi:ATP-binding cassette subfamily B protein